jgi:hypothetical protein
LRVDEPATFHPVGISKDPTLVSSPHHETLVFTGFREIVAAQTTYGVRPGGCTNESCRQRVDDGGAKQEIMVPKSKTVRLVSGFTIDDVAEACRSAAIDFLDGVRDGWGKRELAAWLVGPYHQLSLLRCSADELAFAEVVDHAPRSSSPKRVAEQDVEKTMRDARDQVMKIVQRFASGDPSAETFVWRVRSRGALSRVEDETGRVGLVPNEAPTQRLAERILSLIASDYVARPLDYEDRATICATCKTLTFDRDARESGDCGAHRVSGSGVHSRIDPQHMAPDATGEQDAARLRTHLTVDLVGDLAKTAETAAPINRQTG